MVTGKLNPVEYLVHDVVINTVRKEFGLTPKTMKYILLIMHLDKANPRRFSKADLSFLPYKPYGTVASFHWALKNGYIARVARREYMITEKLYRIANRLEIFYERFKEEQQYVDSYWRIGNR